MPRFPPRPYVDWSTVSSCLCTLSPIWNRSNPNTRYIWDLDDNQFWPVHRRCPHSRWPLDCRSQLWAAHWVPLDATIQDRHDVDDTIDRQRVRLMCVTDRHRVFAIPAIIKWWNCEFDFVFVAHCLFTYLNDTILGTGCNDIIVVRTPCNIQYGTLVTTDQRMIRIYTANLQRVKKVQSAINTTWNWRFCALAANKFSTNKITHVMSLTPPQYDSLDLCCKHFIFYINSRTIYKDCEVQYISF